MGREIVSHLGWPEIASGPSGVPPLRAVDELIGIVPADQRRPFDSRDVIARIVDGSDFFEFKSAYASGMICGHASIDGHKVGILANNGPIMPAGSLKAAQFIQLCDQSDTPLVFLQNTAGYMIGSQAERDGAIKHGAKMIQAVAYARVPKFTIVIGGSFGAGNYGMCGRGLSPRFIFAWPSARTAVMGGEQAARVMEMVARGKAARDGSDVDEVALAKQSSAIRAGIDAQSDALFATARLWDDGIIDPRDTRKVLGLCLQIAAEGEQKVLRPNSFGVARG